MTLNKKEVVIKDEQSFTLRVKMWKCLSPKTLNAVEFIQESKDSDGEVEASSTYQFFMTDDELKNLAKGLVE
jgi:hypothetical protein